MRNFLVSAVFRRWCILTFIFVATGFLSGWTHAFQYCLGIILGGLFFCPRCLADEDVERERREAEIKNHPMAYLHSLQEFVKKEGGKEEDEEDEDV